MMKSLIKIGFLAFAFFGCNAFAEGGCPAGSYPIGGGNAGWQGCAPIPGYDSGQGQDNGPRGHWEDSYGAIVFGDSTEDGSLRYSYSMNYSNENGALNRAFQECQQGGFLNCRKGATFWNGYMVLASGEGYGIYWGIDETEAKAKKRAVNECKTHYKNCEAFKTIDSRAVWVN